MKKRFLYIASLLPVLCLLPACQDDELLKPLHPSDGPEGVSVEVIFDTEEVSDACDLLSPQGTSRSAASHNDVSFNGTSHNGAIKVELLPTSVSRATDLNTDKPVQLTNVNMVQRKRDGTLVQILSNGTVSLGTKQTLNNLKPDEDSDLFVFARNGTVGNDLTTGNLTTCAITSTEINKITESTGIAKMPYFLHLEHVKVVQNAVGNYVIQSNEGYDARLRLRRLAARVNVTWNFNVPGYTLQEVTLQDTPLKYLALPSETESTYPDLMDQYYTFKLYDAATAGATNSASCWVARNVRGTASISNETMRDKERAPQGSSYLRFIATRDGAKDRLIYRIYLGGRSVQDFNVEDNTNYNYNLTFSSPEQIADDDGRVQLLNGAPASKGNTTLVPTANCFMVKPGGSFYFDPFLYRRAGRDDENTILESWAKETARGGICSVKIIWQTRENGDTGDPVLGMVNSKDDHTNIVELTGMDNISLTSVSATGFTTKDQCHIHCRVAPNTTGGNGLIAACDKNGEILWSWHLWVTAYNPDSQGTASVLDDPNKRKQKYDGNGVTDLLPMMDRNLGALAGYVEMPDDDALVRSKANGTLYQRGRKDPFLASFTTKVINSIAYPSNSPTPIEDLQNMYGPDGYSYIARLGNSGGTVPYVTAYKNPYSMYSNGSEFEWCRSPNDNDWEGVGAAKEKGVHDPSPAGWRIPERKNYVPLFAGDWEDTGKRNTMRTPRNLPGGTNLKEYLAGTKNKGLLLTYDNSGNKTYYWLTGYGPNPGKYVSIGEYGWIMTREKGVAFVFGIDRFNITPTGISTAYSWYHRDAHGIRCIQEMP